MREQLAGVDAVYTSEVNYADKTVTCKVAKGTDPKALAAAFEGSRFTVAVKP